MKITGKVVYQNLGTGFWGITGDNGQNWRPDSMPSELQKEGLKVEAEVEELPAQMSMFMWGTNIKIKSFQVK